MEVKLTQEQKNNMWLMEDNRNLLLTAVICNKKTWNECDFPNPSLAEDMPRRTPHAHVHIRRAGCAPYLETVLTKNRLRQLLTPPSGSKQKRSFHRLELWLRLPKRSQLSLRELYQETKLIKAYQSLNVAMMYY